MAKRQRPDRRKGRKKPLASATAGDRYLLDRFSDLDVEAWQSAGDDIVEFEVLRFHALEALRQLHKPALVTALSEIEPVCLDVTGWCRIVDFRYSDNPLSAAGSLKRGGRFNIGSDCDRADTQPFPALYIARNHKTALLERFGKPERESALSATELALRTDASYSFVRLNGCMERTLKLDRPQSLREFTNIIKEFRLPDHIKAMGDKLGYTSPQVVETASVLLTTLLARDWRYLPANHGLPANPQVFAALVREAGFEAISYKSVRGGSQCLAAFPDQFEHSESWLSLADSAPTGVETTRLDTNTWQDLI